MTVLMLHNSYRIRGGEDESFETEWRMLKSAGHSVDVLHLSNGVSAELPKFKIAINAIWSTDSYRLVEKKLSERKYDVLHVQNFFPLFSPSVYSAARKQGVAVVQTLRNYRLLCPSGILFRSGHICEDCLHTKSKYAGIAHACYRDSKLATAAVAAMIGVNTIRGTWRSSVDLYIALTQFSRLKFIEGGFDPETILVKGNCVYPDPGVGRGDEKFMIYVGRLAREKGIATLLSAWGQLPRPGKLKIVGEGPLERMVMEFCASNPSVEWLGPKTGSATKDLMGAASTLIFPSEWYETFGRVAIESFAKGTPVIASNLGAMSEIVGETNSGWLFEPGNAVDLAKKMQWCLDNPEDVHKMRLAARQKYEYAFTAETNCRNLISAYKVARERLAKQIPGLAVIA